MRSKRGAGQGLSKRAGHRGLVVGLLTLLLAACGPLGPGPLRPTESAPRTAAVASPTRTASPIPASDQRTDPELLRRVDRDNALAAAYEPADLVELAGVEALYPGLRLRQEAAEALRRMLSAGRGAGLGIIVSSAYRSYAEQEATYRFWVERLGLWEAERTSARPGHSEHQLGTTVDLTSASVDSELVEGFGATSEGRWLQENAVRYGFVMSYPEGKEAVTGYAYEPWHWRYVGPEAAAAVRASGLTLTEWLGRYGSTPSPLRQAQGRPNPLPSRERALGTID